MKPNTPGFLGIRLKEARESRELTVQGLADILGISRQSVSKYENGDQSPRPEVLDGISKVLRFPRDYFVNERPHDHLTSETPIFYRKLTAATKSVRARAERRYEWLQDIAYYLGDFLEFPDVNFPSFDLPSDPTKISNSYIEELAVETRRFWGFGDGPISNVVWLLENNGAIVGRYAFGADNLDAFSQNLSIERIDGHQMFRPHIMLGNDKSSCARSRFDAAHELGHLVIHKEIPKNIFRDSKFHGLIEKQANRFAGAFLFPRDIFMQEVSSVSLDSLRTLKPRWKLAISMLLHRAKDLSLVGEQEYKNLQINLTRRGWRKKEPLDDEILPEEPKVLKSSVEMLVEQKIQTQSDILSSLRLDRQDVEEIIGLPSGYLTEKITGFDQLRLRRDHEKQELGVFDQHPEKDDKRGVLINFPPRGRLEN